MSGLGRGIGRRILRHGEVDSTSERAFAAISTGEARHGDVHVAAAQTRGRGRRGAVWYSPPGEGLYLSVVLLPEPPPPRAPALTVAAGLAVRDALLELGCAGARMEWPNDVTIGGAKVAGVLLETRGLDPARPHFVLGIGVDVAQRAFPAELQAERPVTSLALAGHPASVEDTLRALLRHLPERLRQAQADTRRLSLDFCSAAGLAGARVRAVGPMGQVTGRLRELSIEGGVELELPSGARDRLALEHVRELEPV